LKQKHSKRDKKSKQSFIYTPLFCEENIWHLANELKQQGVPVSELSVIFLSNPHKKTAIFNQLSAEINMPVIWDYHVILLRASPPEYLIYDFDSRSDFPTSADQYLNSSFPTDKQITDEYQCQFRIIDAENYLTFFSSDRSHMHKLLPPEKFPPYSVIVKPETTDRLNLQTLFDFTRPVNNRIKLLKLADLFQLISQ